MATWELSRGWGVMLLSFVSLLLVAADARAGCETDMECKGDRICRDRACVDADAPPQCDVDADCPGDRVCTDETCVARAAAEKEPAEAEKEKEDGESGPGMNSPGMVIGGSVLGGAGIAAVVAGLAIWSAAQNSETSCYPDTMNGGEICTKQDDDEMMGGGIAVLITGATMVATGVILVIVGAMDAEPEAEGSYTAVTIEPLIGPTGGGLRVRF